MGAPAPTGVAACVPRLRADALLSCALQALQDGDLASALLAAEAVCRHHPEQAIPALLRARILDQGRPALSAAAWYHAWCRDPELPLLQDALLQAWLQAGARASVAELGPAFLPQRCRDTTPGKLLDLLRQAGVSAPGACWVAGAAVEGRLYLAAPSATLLLSDGVRHYQFQVPADGSRFRLLCPHPHAVWSVALVAADAGPPSLLAGSPLVFTPPLPPGPQRRPARARAPTTPTTPTTPASPAMPPTPTRIIVPVYRDAAMVQACLRSVLDSLPHNRNAARLIVVDDASPEPALAAWLDAEAASGRITLLRNPYNLGFIETCNRALRDCTGVGADAMLLNADTLVHGDWLDRLRAALYAAPDIAAVTPWSNNGEISSFPAVGSAAPAPTLAQLARIDASAAALHGGDASADHDLPVCCGFAMLMRASVLAEIGLLDGAALTRGYGEEVDWCLRARAAGYRHRLASGVFIAHAGSVSFRFEKRLRVRQNRAVLQARYPSYHADYARFLQCDPLAAPRAALQTALQQAGEHWLQQALQRQAGRAETAIALPAPLSVTLPRIAVWQYRHDGPGAGAVLTLARCIASLPEARQRLRLLVIGDPSEALWHTGVVDLLPSRLGREHTLLSDSALLGLSGCLVVLSDGSTALPPGLPCTRLTAGFDAAAWLADWLARPAARAA